MRSIKKMTLPLVLALLLAGAYTVPASARLLHTITQAQAVGVADRFGEEAYEAAAWTEGWWRECSRQTPWTFSCSIEIYSEVEGGPDCWREFDVASSVWTGRLRTEHRSAWSCDPWPSSGHSGL